MPEQSTLDQLFRNGTTNVENHLRQRVQNRQLVLDKLRSMFNRGADINKLMIDLTKSLNSNYTQPLYVIIGQRDSAFQQFMSNVFSGFCVETDGMQLCNPNAAIRFQHAELFFVHERHLGSYEIDEFVKAQGSLRKIVFVLAKSIDRSVERDDRVCVLHTTSSPSPSKENTQFRFDINCLASEFSSMIIERCMQDLSE